MRVVATDVTMTLCMRPIQDWFSGLWPAQSSGLYWTLLGWTGTLTPNQVLSLNISARPALVPEREKYYCSQNPLLGKVLLKEWHLLKQHINAHGFAKRFSTLKHECLLYSKSSNILSQPFQCRYYRQTICQTQQSLETGWNSLAVFR